MYNDFLKYLLVVFLVPELSVVDEAVLLKKGWKVALNKVWRKLNKQ